MMVFFGIRMYYMYSSQFLVLHLEYQLKCYCMNTDHDIHIDVDLHAVEKHQTCCVSYFQSNDNFFYYFIISRQNLKSRLWVISEQNFECYFDSFLTKKFADE